MEKLFDMAEMVDPTLVAAGRGLPMEQEQYLATHIQAGKTAVSQELDDLDPHDRAEVEMIIDYGRAAQKMLIQANLGLVFHIANKFQKYGVYEFGDFITAGYFGLRQAAWDYQPNGVARFSTYAYTAVYSHASSAANEHLQPGFRIPPNAGRMRFNFEKQMARLSVQLGRTATVEELAAASHTSAGILRALNMRRFVGLDEADPDDEAYTSAARSHDPKPRPKGQERLIDELDPEAVVLRALNREDVRTALAGYKMKERALEMMKLRLGSENTLEAIASQYSLTRERVRQILTAEYFRIGNVLGPQWRTVYGDEQPSDAELEAWARPKPVLPPRLGRLPLAALTPPEKQRLEKLVQTYHEMGTCAESIDQSLLAQGYNFRARLDLYIAFIDRQAKSAPNQLVRSLKRLAAEQGVVAQPMEKLPKPQNDRPEYEKLVAASDVLIQGLRELGMTPTDRLTSLQLIRNRTAILSHSEFDQAAHQPVHS